MIPTETPAPSANGELIDRVQRLRLDTQLGAGVRAARGSWLPWVLCGLMAVAWAGVGVRWYKVGGSGDGPASGAPGAPGAKGAGVSGPSNAGPAPSGPAPVAPGELVLQIKGTLTPFLQINLSPIDVSGEIVEVNFKEGDRVTEGKVLARIRDARYRNDAKSAEAALLGAQAQVLRAEASEAAARSRLEKTKEMVASARSRIAKAEASVTQTVRDYDRAVNNTTSVAERDAAEAKKTIAASEKVAADADLKAAEAEKIAADADVKAAEAGVKAAKADEKGMEARKDEADRVLANCEIKSPLDGTILTKLVERGSLVSPMSFNVAAGICSMADLSDLEVEIDVPEKQIGGIKPGFECQVTADAYPTKPYRGRIDRIMPIADDSKNVIKVRVKVILPPGEGPGSFLKPKMSTTVAVYNKPFDEKK